MIYLDPEAENVKTAKERHYKALKCRITRKLGGEKCENELCQICSSRSFIFSSDSNTRDAITIFLGDKLEDILCELPSKLQELNDSFFETILGEHWEQELNNYYVSQQKEKEHKLIYNLFKDLHKLFDYDWLCGLQPVPINHKENNYSLYELAGQLNIRTCIYCNRTYTNTLTTKDNKKLMRPQFDHWFPKWRYPLIACSFYNLIPSCYTCNSSSKGKTLLNLTEHIHPYLDKEVIENFQFDYIYSNVSSFHIYIKRTNKDKKVLKTLKKINIDRMYNAHHEELQDLIKLKNAYGENYIQRMIKLFPKTELNVSEIYKLVFGVELQQKDFHKRPMSKFKHDILKELGIIS